MPIARRSLQSKTGVTIRTRKGTTVSPESGPTNSVGFGANNTTSGASLLAAPGAGKTWVITSLIVSWIAGQNGAGGQITFTGGLSFAFTGSTGNLSGNSNLINNPMAAGDNTAFGSSFSMLNAPPNSSYSVSGTAYSATIPTIVNPQTAQSIAVSIDSNPPGDLG